MRINKELLRETLQTIKDNPQHWNQRNWHCETSHCFAGFVECKLRGHNLGEEVPYGWTIETKGYLEYILSINSLDDDERFEQLNIYYSNETNHRILPRIALGLSVSQADKLFCVRNKLEDLERIVEELCTQDQESTD